MRCEYNYYNYMSRKIGIYCTSKNNAQELIKQIVEFIPEDSIKHIRNGFSEQFIEMKDGTVYRFIVPSDGARGCAFHEAYIQPGIDKTIYDSIIRPCVKIGHGTIYLIEDLTDLYYRNKLADEYYQSILNNEQ